MFLLDSLNNIERVSIYLSRPSGEPLACLDEYIEEQTANMVRGLNQQQELTFTINKQNNDWYEYIQEGMYLYVETVGLFRMKQPSVNIDGVKETKVINALSCDVELEDKNLSIEINMGTKTSQEYLVQFDDADVDEEVVNPYVNVPYDWVVLYNTFPEQLTSHLNDYDNGFFGTPNQEITVTDSDKIEILINLFNLIPRLKNKFIKTIDSGTESTNYTLVEYVNISTNSSTGAITSIKLFNTYRSRVIYLIGFYTRNRDKLSLLQIVLSKMGGSWSVGDIYGISNNNYSLANKKFQFDISSNIYSFLLSDFAQVSNCMVTFDIFNRKVNITPVENIGRNTGITISYDNLLNSLEINADEDNLITRLIVTGADDLSIEQVNFGLDYIDDLSYKMNAVDENGKRIYVTNEFASKYSSYIAMRENNRESYIQLSKDYINYEKKINEIKYRVPLDDLKTDWGTFTEDELVASLTTYKNLLVALISMYRNDYYPEGINQDDSINEDFIKGTMYWYDYEAYKEIIKEIECAISTYPYYSDHDKWTSYNIALYENSIKEWETEWTLYGTIELQAKIDAYKANMDLLAESSVIRTSADSDTIKTWSELTESEKQQFGNLSGNYQYDIYMADYNNMVSAQQYLATLQNEINILVDNQKNVQESRSSIVENVALENNFTESELKILYLMFRDSDCSNKNILVTTIDSVDKKIETMRDLLEYGEEQLSRMSRPQLSFSISSDNLLSLKDYEPYWSDFKVGNYLMVQYRDDTFIKLRMIGYEYNPCLPSLNDFKITFSNSIRSKVGVTDLENLLGLSESSGRRSSSGGSGGSESSYGESDKIDVTISNTMLSKLLNSETFGTRVKDVILNTIDVNSITAKYAAFSGLTNGTTTIDGKCITTGWIISDDYNSSDGAIDNTTGSIINLDDGYFNFAGGKLKWDGSVFSVKGHIEADTGKIGGWTIGADNISSINSSGNAAILANGSDSNQNVLYIRNGAGTTASPYVYPFILRANGTLTATNATINGTLTADAGSKIGSWNVDTNCIWYGNKNYGYAGGLYFGTSGLSLGSTFKVSNSGAMTATSGTIGNWKINGSLQSNIANFTSFINPDVFSISSTSSGISASLSTSGLQVTQPSSDKYSSVSVSGIESTGHIVSTNGHVSSRHPSDAHTYAQNTSTTCYISCRSVNDGIHGLYSNGYWNGSAFVSSGRYLIYRNKVDNTLVPSELYTHNEGYTTARPVVGTNAGTNAVGVIVSNSATFGIYGRWAGGDTASMSGRTISCPGSDIRLKENVKDSTVDALSVINAIRIRQFDWKDKSRGHWDCGMVVDEMENDVDPKFRIGGGEDEDGNISYKCVDTFYLQGYEVKAIQELHAEIKHLKQQIIELKER